MTNSQEIELKLEVEPGCSTAIATLPELGGAPSRTRQQTSVYFDTSAQDLRRAGLSLRIRHADGKRVQTIKAEAPGTAGLFARPEWEREIKGDRPELDEPAGGLARLLAGRALGDLHPIFTADVTRSSWEVTLHNARIEIVLDQGRIKAGDRAAPVGEIELELLQGEPAALFTLARAVAARTPVRVGVLTKSERGYRLLDGEEDRAVKAAPVVLTDEMNAAEAFQAIARACLRQFRLNETLLLATRGGQPLHQARVALRRLRSALSLFKPLIEDDRFEGFRLGLRALAAQLGKARNLDVLIARTGDSALSTTLLAARESAYDDVCETLSAAHTRDLLLALVEWIAIGPWLSRSETASLRRRRAERFAGDLLDRYRKRLKRGGRRLVAIDDEGRHELRILAKKLRYAAEFFGELYTAKPAPRRRKAFLAALEALQSHLGDLNDHATGRAVLSELGIADDAAEDLLGSSIDRTALLADAADAYEVLIDMKRFWR